MSVVMAGIEDSEEALDGLGFAEEFALARGAELRVVAVYTDTIFIAGLEEIEESRELYFEQMLALAEREVASPFEFHRMVETSVAAGLTKAAVESGAECVVVGSSHRGPIGRVLMGDNGSQLATGSECPVVVVPRGWVRRDRESLKRIGVAFSGSPESRDALEYATDLATKLGADLKLTGVVPYIANAGRIGLTDQGYEAILREEMHKTLDTAVEATNLDGVETEVRVGSAADALAEASEGLDLLVLGSRRYGPVKRVILGGTSVRVMRSSACPVVVVPRSSE